MRRRRALRAGARLLVAGALFFALPACASARRSAPPPGTPVRLEGVPFFPQAGEGCGASALASVLARLGRPTDPAELVRECAAPGLKGILVTDLADAARRRGFEAEVAQPDTEGVVALVASGTPVILLLDDGRLFYSVPHYVVAFGLLPEGLLVHSGDLPERVVPWGELGRKRSRMGNLALVVRAKGGSK